MLLLMLIEKSKSNKYISHSTTLETFHKIQIIIHGGGGGMGKKKNQNESQKNFYSYQLIPAKYTDVQYQNKPTPTASEN